MTTQGEKLALIFADRIAPRPLTRLAAALEAAVKATAQETYFLGEIYDGSPLEEGDHQNKMAQWNRQRQWSDTATHHVIHALKSLDDSTSHPIDGRLEGGSMLSECETDAQGVRPAVTSNSKVQEIMTRYSRGPKDKALTQQMAEAYSMAYDEGFLTLDQIEKDIDAISQIAKGKAETTAHAASSDPKWRILEGEYSDSLMSDLTNTFHESVVSAVLDSLVTVASIAAQQYKEKSWNDATKTRALVGRKWRKSPTVQALVRGMMRTTFVGQLPECTARFATMYTEEIFISKVYSITLLTSITSPISALRGSSQLPLAQHAATPRQTTPHTPNPLPVLFKHKNPSAEWTPGSEIKPYPLRNADCASAEHARGEGRARLHSLTSSGGWNSGSDSPDPVKIVLQTPTTPGNGMTSPRWREHMFEDMEERERKNEQRFPSPPPLPAIPSAMPNLGNMGRTLMGQPKRNKSLSGVMEEEFSMDVRRDPRGQQGTFGSVGGTGSMAGTKTFGSVGGDM